MPEFTRSNVSAARMFLNSVYSGGGTHRGRGAKAPADLSERQVLRYANALRAQADRGEPLSLQAARGHRGATVGERREHPRQFVLRQREGRRTAVRVPRSITPGETIYRDYRDPAALMRWIQNRLPAGTDLQITAHGIPHPTYLTLDQASGRVRKRLPDDDDEPPAWRTIYTGDTTGVADANGVTLRSLDELWHAAHRVFKPGTVDAWSLRWR